MVQSQSSQLKSKIVKAGAGTGKTTYLIEEVFKEIQKEISAQESKTEPRLIICTFTRKATKELKERLIEEALKLNEPSYLRYINSSSLYISTIHGILSLFLKEYGIHYDIHPDFEVISEDENERILQRVLARYIYKKEYLNLAKNLSLDHIISILKKYSKNKLLYPDVKFADKDSFKEFKKSQSENSESCNKKSQSVKELKKSQSVNPEYFLDLFKEMQELGDEVHENFLKEKKKLNVLTYDDMELFSLDLMNKTPRVAQNFSKEWDYWFIDEYQDTSLIQEMIFNKLTQFKNVFCVGDPQQSIYSFRGADPNVFQNRMEDKKMKENTLKVNYRSKPSLVCFFNDFFKNEKDIINLESKNQTKDKDPVVFIFKSDSEKKAENVFKMIAYHIMNLRKKGIQYKDICILGVNNNHIQSLSLYLKKQNISVQAVDKNHFSFNRIVLDSLFVIKFLINPHDKENLLALLRTPYFYISDKDLSILCRDYHDLFDDRNEVSPKSKKYISFWNFIKDKNNIPIQKLNTFLRLQKSQGMLHTFENIIFQDGFMDLVLRQDSSGLQEAYLWKLLSLIRKAEQTDNHSVLDLFYKVIRVKEEEDSDPTELSSFLELDAVDLMTVHKSKGLQFKHVLIFDISTKIQSNKNDVVFDAKRKEIVFSVPPLTSPWDEKMKCYSHLKAIEELKLRSEEERKRMTYVAITRAQESVALFIPEKRVSSKSKSSSPLDKCFFKIASDYVNRIIPQPSGYAIQVKTEVEDIEAIQINPSFASEIKPYKASRIPEVAHIKSAQDFIDETNPAYQMRNQKKEEEKFIANYSKNSFFKSYLGNQMHEVFQLLTKHQPFVVRDKLNKLELKEKDTLLKSLDYISHLKDPDLQYFFQKGYSEWPLQFKTKKALLKGRVDLWGQKEDRIWIFDYKSSSSVKSNSLFKQLSFYAFILDQIHQPKEIFLCGVYPLEQKVETLCYSDEHKKQILSWLHSIG